MSRFTDGPAAGVTLLLQRAPLMLRVVERERKFDALDMPEDQASPGEKLSVYIQRGTPTGAFIDGRDPRTGKRTGGYRLLAVYEYLDPATFPHDPETFRDNAAWANWCRANEPALRQLWSSLSRINGPG